MIYKLVGMSKPLEIIKDYLAQSGLSAAKFAHKLGLSARTMQHRLRDDNFKVEELEEIERVFDIAIFARSTKENVANVEEPVLEYNQKLPSQINITIQLSPEGSSVSDSFQQKLEDLLPEFLEFEKRQTQKRHEQDTE